MERHKTELPYAELLEQCKDSEVFIHNMMRWHFSKETGTEFWLRLADSLDFDPIRDIKTFRDLKKFPDISSKLRLLRVEELIPRGLSGLQPQICESGGLTGNPKLFIIYEEWVKMLAEWIDRPESADDHGKIMNLQGNVLAVVPTGPHSFGLTTRLHSNALGGLCFHIDFDPRWVRYSIQNGYAGEAERYAAHILRQIDALITTQDIAALVITPPLLSVLAGDDDLMKKMRGKLRYVMMAGAQVNLDEVQLIGKTQLPDCAFRAFYGSSSVISCSRSQLIKQETEQLVYQSFSPFITYDIVNPKTLESVELGERGRVVATHISPYAFFPQVFERDTAVKLPPARGGFGFCAGDVIPDKIVDGKEVITGVY